MRNQIEDIIIKKKSIRQIPIPKNRKFFNRISETVSSKMRGEINPVSDEPESKTIKRKKNSNRTTNRFILTSISVVVILFVVAKGTVSA